MTDQLIPLKEVAKMADKVKDPVCGMEIDPAQAAATEVHEGQTFYFCSQACHDTFVKDPHRYGHPSMGHGEHGHH
ncbi:MAG: YHS domain-containing protein [Candidatus Limnocylindrales bacterium]